MTPDEKLATILAAVQTDPGNRGLARDPHDNLFTATAGDFQRACRSLLAKPDSGIDLLTGFPIPVKNPPPYETDGPLGCTFLMRSLLPYFPHVSVGSSGWDCNRAILGGLTHAFGGHNHPYQIDDFTGGHYSDLHVYSRKHVETCSHTIVIEHAGPATNRRCYTMKGRDISDYVDTSIGATLTRPQRVSIGIGDGGNEIGMGKIPHETIVKNIPNGDLIHCRVPTDHLIVAGVSNWGAYALAAGLFVLKGVTPPPDLFDPDREREILEVMVKAGPLVDGVTGEQTATVDGLTWEEYVKPLIQIRDILNA